MKSNETLREVLNALEYIRIDSSCDFSFLSILPVLNVSIVSKYVELRFLFFEVCFNFERVIPVYK